MAYRRTAIRQFSIANAAYRNALITFYKVNETTLEASPLLATVFSSPSGDDIAANPYTLDADGKFVVPLYTEEPVIISINQSSVGSHQTGIVYPDSGGWRGDWATGTDYLPGEFIRDGAAGENTGNVYIAASAHTSGTWLTDLSQGKWTLAIEASVVNLETGATGVLPQVNGGTGANNSSAARTNLGLAIGSDVQAYSSTLQAVVAGTYTGNVNISVLGTILQGTWQGTAIADSYIASAASWNAKLSSTAALAALAPLVFAADKMIYGTGTDAVALATLTAFARTILDDADASAALSTLGVSTFIKTLLDDADETTARATLNAQAADATLASIAAIAGVQGDLMYATGADAWARLAKDANATRYLSNTGSNNNPAWSQVALNNGVTGTLPVPNGGAGRTSHTEYAVICGGTTTTAAQQSVASVGTAGQALVSNGAGALPSFQNITGAFASAVYATSTTLSTAAFLDDTIMQNTEGDQIASVTITPRRATSSILLLWDFYGGAASDGATIVTGVFQDSTADALAVAARYNNNAMSTRLNHIHGMHVVAAGSTSARDFKLRAGCDTGNLYPNSTGSPTRVFGGAKACRLIAIELLA